MRIKVIGRNTSIPSSVKSELFLIWDYWNDYSFRTLFGLTYVDENSKVHFIGSVKIGFIGQEEGEPKLKIGDNFISLTEDYFSLGQSDKYYESLNLLGDEVRDQILESLNDIARYPHIYDTAIKERVTRISLLRSVSQSTVTGQFRRMSTGGARLTNYSFKFTAPRTKDSITTLELSFDVVPGAQPPTNIHVIIGRNGVGKTHLINSMINSLTETGKTSGYFSTAQYDRNTLFANLTSVTFSAFDESEPKEEQKDKTKGIQFSYIGLKRVQTGSEKNEGPKSTVMLKNEFVKSLQACKLDSKSLRWQKSLEMLESDTNFKDAAIKEIINIEDDSLFKETAFDIFKKLSSGHKIILLTITRLIETLQEKSLVLIDEPEAHLHPPLLSAFTRTLSELLIDTNSVAIIATHSPVILQEIPRSCIWKIWRSGTEMAAERLSIESFGENVGRLTNEIFGLEVTHSGYYKMISQVVDDADNYNAIIDHFNGQIGLEGKAIIMSLIANKQTLQ